MKTNRKGYILVVVLGLTAVVATLGFAFVESHSTILAESANRASGSRAQYLAESGVSIATHYLLYPPTSVSVDDYWHGATGIAIDATSDYTDVVVVEDDEDENIYTIDAVGVAHDSEGSICGKRSIRAEVLVPSDGKWHIPYAMVGQKSGLSVPQSVYVAGDLHLNGKLAMFGWCPGAVSATGSITGATWGPPESVTPNADEYEAPPFDVSLYQNYNIRGEQYAAYTSFSYDDMFDYEADWLNAQNWSSNPGHIICVKGDFLLHGGVNLQGTLVVDGKLTIGGAQVTITAYQNFPALVVKDDIYFRYNGGSLVANGSVLCGDDIDDDYNGAAMDVNGAFILNDEFKTGSFGDSFVFTWDPVYSVFWNFAESAELDPITILSWKEE